MPSLTLTARGRCRAVTSMKLDITKLNIGGLSVTTWPWQLHKKSIMKAIIQHLPADTSHHIHGPDFCPTRCLPFLVHLDNRFKTGCSSSSFHTKLKCGSNFQILHACSLASPAWCNCMILLVVVPRCHQKLCSFGPPSYKLPTICLLLHDCKKQLTF